MVKNHFETLVQQYLKIILKLRYSSFLKQLLILHQLMTYAFLVTSALSEEFCLAQLSGDQIFAVFDARLLCLWICWC